MPSPMHEPLIELFRQRPELVSEVAQTALYVSVPPHASAVLAEASFAQLVPPEYHADLVILLKSC